MDGDGRVDDLTMFVRRATPGIRAALLKRGLRGVELEDCVQEVLTEVTERWEKLRSYAALARYAYVSAVCRGTAVGWLRRARFRSDVFVQGEAEREPDPCQSASPERAYLGARVRSAVQSCLADADPAARTTFALVYLAGHTEAEAACMQGVPRGTVASRLRRVRSQLRERLREK